MAVFPQQIKAYLSRGADFKSLATAADVARCSNRARPRSACRLRRPKTPGLPLSDGLHRPPGGQRGICPGRDRIECVDHPFSPRDLQAPAAQQHRGAAGGGASR